MIIAHLINVAVLVAVVAFAIWLEIMAEKKRHNQPLTIGETMQHLTIPPLAEGETYIGAIGNKAGEIYHLILLAGESEPAPHKRQIEWAKSIGVDLPNRLEAMMLFVHAKDQFKPEAYWTGEIYVDRNGEEDPAWAWCQHFCNGYQHYRDRFDELRARAVRRLPI